MTNLETVLSRVDANADDGVERLFELLRIPSISTDPAYKGDCETAAEWLRGALQEIGFEASVIPTTGMPMVVAHHTPSQLGNEVPHVLFYGHYDVQPADPLELWDRPPFEPAVVKGDDGVERIYARGACDDKGQLMTFLEASRAWVEEIGHLPVKVTVLIEGEEESGSPSLDAFLDEYKDELSRDMALICDTGMWDADTPAISTRLRGIMHDEVFITGPSRDLHSGMYGGAARNPIRVLTNILGKLHDEDGRVTIPGFYYGVEDISDELREQWGALNFSKEDFLGDVGLSELAGEKGYSALEQIWARPTCDINGIVGGYIGDGTKTVIPSQASAKLSFRLVPGQDPEAIRTAFREMIVEQLPLDCNADFQGERPGTPLEVPQDDPYLQKAAHALQDEFGKPAVMMGCGGSIPIATSFKEELSMNSLLIGFGLDDDQIHSPNEKYNLSSFKRGSRSWVRVLEAIAK
ncbi:MAG: dipeptidase [Hyphomicrobiales bacterium]